MIEVETGLHFYTVKVRKVCGNNIGDVGSVPVIAKSVTHAADVAERYTPGYEATDVICKQTNVIVEDYNYD